MVHVLMFLSAAGCFTTAMVGLTALFTADKHRMHRRVAVLKSNSPDVTLVQTSGQRPDPRKAVITRCWVIVRSKVKVSANQEHKLMAKIKDAGLKCNPRDVLLTQYLLCVAFAVLVLLLFGRAETHLGRVLVLATLAGCFGIWYPRFFLTGKAKARRSKVEEALPDFFDMLNLSIEAGLGLDMAFMKVCRQLGGPLSDEFLVVLEDMKRGMTRRQAFSELKRRASSEQLGMIISAIIQADQMGVGMAKVIRAQTERIRELRLQAAKEKAMKAPVKMMIPMVLFIFPTLFVVLLGPAGLALMRGGL